MFRLDEFEQYGRRENIRIHGIPESNNSADDGEKILRTIAEELHIELNDLDIQRVHLPGRKKKSTQAKPRTTTARFVSYRKRNQFMYANSKLSDSSKFKEAFITEDLTPLRSTLLRYVKTECDGKFVLCHTYNGKIRMKQSAKFFGKQISSSKDEGFGDWIVIFSPDDLFRYDIDVDFAKFNYKPLMFNASVTEGKGSVSFDVTSQSFFSRSKMASTQHCSDSAKM